MYPRSVLLALLAALSPSCKSVDCGDGTTERNGSCVAASQTVSAARCGPFTELHGDTCIPIFPPTVCDPGTTAEDTDKGTGVTTCIGTGVSGCSARLACPVGTGGKQTICGQIYDFETSLPFAQAGATGAPCGAGTGATSGPCALGVRAFDAGMITPTGGGALASGTAYIDDCGRFRIPDVSQPGAPGLIVVGVDDLAQPGPSGLANPAGVAIPAMANGATKDVEAFLVKPSTIALWSGPSLAAGIFALVYHSKFTGTELAAGVTLTRNTVAGDAAHTFYSAAALATRTALDPNAHVTGANGTAFYSITSPVATDMYSGTGGLPSGCTWESHLGAAIPGQVFIQAFRPTGASCTP
jgi:hypothetical protein